MRGALSLWSSDSTKLIPLFIFSTPQNALRLDVDVDGDVDMVSSADLRFDERSKMRLFAPKKIFHLLLFFALRRSDQTLISPSHFFDVLRAAASVDVILRTARSRRGMKIAAPGEAQFALVPRFSRWMSHVPVLTLKKWVEQFSELVGSVQGV